MQQKYQAHERQKLIFRRGYYEVKEPPSRLNVSAWWAGSNSLKLPDNNTTHVAEDD